VYLYNGWNRNIQRNTQNFAINKSPVSQENNTGQRRCCIMVVPLKPVYLYNTLTKRKDLFQPLHSPKVGIYSCGPTVYKDIHIGNLRTFVMTDLLRRMLEYNGYDVYLVRNITDVGHLQNDTEESGEDKLEHEARTTGRS